MGLPHPYAEQLRERRRRWGPLLESVVGEPPRRGGLAAAHRAEKPGWRRHAPRGRRHKSTCADAAECQPAIAAAGLARKRRAGRRLRMCLATALRAASATGLDGRAKGARRQRRQGSCRHQHSQTRSHNAARQAEGIFSSQHLLEKKYTTRNPLTPDQGLWYSITSALHLSFTWNRKSSIPELTGTARCGPRSRSTGRTKGMR